MAELHCINQSSTRTLGTPSFINTELTPVRSESG